MGVYVSAIYNEKHNYKEADKMERYGYIRVSAKDQNPERQFLAMQEQQIKKKNIYLDKISGKSFVPTAVFAPIETVKKR